MRIVNWLERAAFGRSTAGNDVVVIFFIIVFFFSFLLAFFLFSPSQPFLREGVLGSKNLFGESCLEHPKTQTCKKIIFVREPNFGKKKCPDNLFRKFSKLRVMKVKIWVFYA